MKRAVALDETSARKRGKSSSYLGMIKVKVGPEPDASTRELFSVHEDIIIGRSDFFRAACKKEWSRGQEKVVPLPTQKPETFHLYLDIVYNRATDSAALAEIAGYEALDNSQETDLRALVAIDNLCKLWVMVDFLGDTDATDRTIDAIVDIYRGGSCRLHFETVDYVARECSQQSGLYRLIVDLVSRNTTADGMADIVDLPDKFVRSILQELARLRGRRAHRGALPVSNYYSSVRTECSGLDLIDSQASGFADADSD